MQPILDDKFYKGSPATIHYIGGTNKLIMILLGIRLFYAGLAALTVQSLPVVLAGLNIIYTFTTYLVTAILIWRVRSNLYEYRISKVALIVFLVSVPYQLFVALSKLVPLTYVPILPLLPVTAWLAVSLIKDRQVRLINQPALPRWLLIGAGAGILFGILAGLFTALQSEHMVNTDSALNMTLGLTIQISNAAVLEEPLFRAFLWVYLLKHGWEEHLVWLFQAFLFWIAHIYYIPSGELFSFWIISPIAGLFIGWIAWKARDIAPSMLAHGIFNGLAQIVGEIARG